MIEEIVIFYTEILMRKVVSWYFFTSETSEKIHKQFNFSNLEKDISATQIQSNNDNIQIITKVVSPLERIINTPGLVHIAENIFNNLDYEDVKVCRDINQSSQQILDKPMFWLRKFRQLSKKNQEDWIKFIQSVNNSEMEKAIISYLQSNLKKETILGPQIWICKWVSGIGQIG